MKFGFKRIETIGMCSDQLCKNHFLHDKKFMKSQEYQITKYSQQRFPT